MAYNKKKLYEKALKVAADKKCFFIEQVIAFTGISKPTFYDYFPTESNEINAIKEILTANKVEVKSSMFKKWYDSDNPTLQVALMKLIATDDEAHRLNGSRTEQTVKGVTQITFENHSDKFKFDDNGESIEQ